MSERWGPCWVVEVWGPSGRWCGGWW